MAATRNSLERKPKASLWKLCILCSLPASAYVFAYEFSDARKFHSDFFLVQEKQERLRSPAGIRFPAAAGPAAFADVRPFGPEMA